MSKNELIAQTEKTFEDIKHVDENGNEYCYARELMLALGYKEWRYFEGVVKKAKIACENSKINALDHFVVDTKMVRIGSGVGRLQKDYKLTRCACYVIIQNANPKLKNVALAQTYFAVKTRQQEYIGGAELGINIFRMTQTEELTRKNKINTERDVCAVNSKVEKVIKELSATKTED